MVHDPDCRSTHIRASHGETTGGKSIFSASTASSDRIYPIYVEKIMYKRSLFIFRQDLRLQDNTALIEAISYSEEVFPIFIHDTRAIEDFGVDDARF